MIFISGQVQRKDMIGDKNVRQNGFQEINIIDIVKPITKYAKTILDPQEIKRELHLAIKAAKSGRPGPVWIDIPLDVQAAEIDVDSLETYTYESSDEFPLRDYCPYELVRDLESSKRPVILMGNGARSEKDSIIAFAEKHKIPILTT